MGFQVVVMFIGSFMDDVTYVTDVEVRMYSIICYIRGCIWYGSKNFGLGSLYDNYVGLAGPTPQFYSVVPYRFNYRFVDEYFIFYRYIFFPINQFIS
jgi:hypothetical protein